MRGFRWLGSGTIAPSQDLRRRGWWLKTPETPSSSATSHDATKGHAGGECLLLLDGAHRQWRHWLLGDNVSARRRWTLVLGVDDPEERARLLALGVGDVAGMDASLSEIEQRATRIIRQIDFIPRQRRHGPLRLDLFDRDGFVGEKPLGLHPREFALLWRLLDHPGELVDKAVLLRDVWRLRHMPETNSIAVHASRLRSKLEYVGLGGLVQTAPAGGYFVAPVGAMAGKQRKGGNGSSTGNRGMIMAATV